MNYADSNQSERYVRAFCQEYFEKNNRQAPSINVVLFLADDEKIPKEQKQAIQKYVRYFKGKMKEIRGLAGITKSSTSGATKN